MIKFGLLGILICAFMHFLNENLYFERSENFEKNDTIIKSLKKYIEKDNIKNLIKSIVYDEFGNMVYEKDSVGNVINEKYYEYNSDNKCISKTLYYNNGKVKNKFSYKYSKYGNLEEEIYEDNEIWTTLKYSFDLSNRLLNTEKFNIKVEPLESTEYKYNTNGKIVEIKTYNFITKDTFKIEFKYDQTGKLIQKNDIRFVDESNFYFYVYDERGNQIEEKCYFPVKDFLWQRNLKEYDNQNRLIYQEISANENRSNDTITHQSKTEYKYENTRLIEEENYISDWNFSNTAYKKIIYEYNKYNGIQAEYIIEYSGGLDLDTLRYKIIYEYEYK